MDVTDTIVAIASAAGGGIRGVVRISGPLAIQVARTLTGGLLPDGLLHAAVHPADIWLPDKRTLPAHLLVWPGTKSYTREPTVEIHTVGSPPLLDLVVRMATDRGARLAAPGEFTMRAFLAGRIDLTQAEAVLGVIDATNDRGLETALKQLAGGLAGPLRHLREELLLMLADLEAGLDFADEDIEFISAEVLAARLAAINDQIAQLVEQLETRSVTSQMPKVMLAGPTNVGKSSLFNALVQRFGNGERATPAIESPEPGATRDYLTATIVLAGVQCELVDTAGVEQVGCEASPSSAAQGMTNIVREEAALVLDCIDATAASVPHDLVTDCVATDGAMLRIVTKADQLEASPPPGSAIATSAATGAGLDALATAVAQRLTDATGDTMIASTAERSSGSLRSALSAVLSGQELATAGHSEELVAMEIRSALGYLGQVAGVVYTDDILDRVFSRFCIGK